MSGRGKELESIISKENQLLLLEERACVYKNPELFSIGKVDGQFVGYPSTLGISDFSGTIMGGRAVFFEAKMDSGALRRNQLLFLANQAHFGAAAFVYRMDGGRRSITMIDAKGKKSKPIQLQEGQTWLDALS